MATGLMIVTVALSRVLGFVRESLLMAYFGQGALTDVYKQSFIIPDTLYFLIAGGALSSAFIPVFTKYMTNGDEDSAWKTFSVVACAVVIVTMIFVGVGEIYAIPFARLVSPGFKPLQIQHVAYLTRIILPAQLFFLLGGLMMGALYSRNKFLAPSFGPLIYTVGIITGGLITAHIHRNELAYLHRPEVIEAMKTYFNAKDPSQLPQQIKTTVESAMQMGTRAVSGYSWGALLGAFVGNFLLQVIAIRKIGMKFIPSLDVKFEGAKRVFALMLPVILGLSLPQVDVQLNKYFATMLGTGSVTALDNANRLMQVPYGVLGTAFAIALFPTLSAFAAQSLWGDFRTHVSQGIRRVTFMALPASVMMMVLSIPTVRLVFQHGKLVTNHDTSITAITLVLFCSGIFAWCWQAVIARAFYALHDTKTVVITGTIMTALFVGMSVGFIRLLSKPWFFHALHIPRSTWWAPAGLALITSIAAAMHAFVLMWILRNRINGLDGKNMLISLGKMFFASGVMAAATYPLYHKVERIVNSASGHDVHRTLSTAVEIAAVGTVGIIIYCIMAWIMKMPELENAFTMFKGRFSRSKA